MRVTEVSLRQQFNGQFADTFDVQYRYRKIPLLRYLTKIPTGTDRRYGKAIPHNPEIRKHRYYIKQVSSCTTTLLTADTTAGILFCRCPVQLISALRTDIVGQLSSDLFDQNLGNNGLKRLKGS
jgi:hypothetical protein